VLLLLKAQRNFQFRKITPVQPVWGLWQVKYMIAMHIFFRLRSSPGFMCACKIPGNVKAPQWKGHFFWGGEVTAHCGFFVSTSLLFTQHGDTVTMHRSTSKGFTTAPLVRRLLAAPHMYKHAQSLGEQWLLFPRRNRAPSAPCSR